ncbi:hypothetical protein pb186bvf_001829 [Paramecium bursaria]
MQQVQRLIDTKQYKKALEQNKILLEKEPQSQQLNILQANILRNLHQYSRSLEVIQTVLIKQDPDTQVPAYMSKGQTLQKMNKHQLALQCFEKVQQVSSKMPELHIARGIINLLISLGDSYWSLEQFQDAINAYNDAIKIDPENKQAMNGKGLVYLELKDIQKSIKWFDKAIKFDPNYPSPYNNKGNAYREAKDYDKALEFYEKALNLDPKYIDALDNKAFLLSEQRKFDESLEVLEQALNIDPDDKLIYIQKGNVLMEKQLYNDALDCFTKALRLDPRNLFALKRKGDAYQKLYDNDKALEFYNKAILYSNEYVLAYYSKSYVYYLDNKFNESIEAINKGIKLEPKYSSLYYIRSLIYLQEENYNSSISQLTQALTLQPKNPLYLICIAKLYFLTNDNKQSEYLNQANENKMYDSQQYFELQYHELLRNKDDIELTLQITEGLKSYQKPDKKQLQIKIRQFYKEYINQPTFKQEQLEKYSIEKQEILLSLGIAKPVQIAQKEQKVENQAQQPQNRKESIPEEIELPGIDLDEEFNKLIDLFHKKVEEKGAEQGQFINGFFWTTYNYIQVYDQLTKSQEISYNDYIELQSEVDYSDFVGFMLKEIQFNGKHLKVLEQALFFALGSKFDNKFETRKVKINKVFKTKCYSNTEYLAYYLAKALLNYEQKEHYEESATYDWLIANNLSEFTGFVRGSESGIYLLRDIYLSSSISKNPFDEIVLKCLNGAKNQKQQPQSSGSGSCCNIF